MTWMLNAVCWLVGHDWKSCIFVTDCERCARCLRVRPKMLDIGDRENAN